MSATSLLSQIMRTQLAIDSYMQWHKASRFVIELGRMKVLCFIRTRPAKVEAIDIDKSKITLISHPTKQLVLP